MSELVYLATSPNVNTVKVGYWTNNEKLLLSRYKTYYGAQTQLWVFRCSMYAAKAEAAFKQRFANMRDSMELYKKSADYMRLYLDFLYSYEYCHDVQKIGKHDEVLEEENELRTKLLTANTELCSAKQALEEMRSKYELIHDTVQRTEEKSKFLVEIVKELVKSSPSPAIMELLTTRSFTMA